MTIEVVTGEAEIRAHPRVQGRRLPARCWKMLVTYGLEANSRECRRCDSFVTALGDEGRINNCLQWQMRHRGDESNWGMSWPACGLWEPTVRYRGPEDPMRFLALKVIESGLVSACRDPGLRSTRMDRRWFMVPNDVFEMWCDMADLAPDRVRKAAAAKIAAADAERPARIARGKAAAATRKAVREAKAAKAAQEKAPSVEEGACPVPERSA